MSTRIKSSKRHEYWKSHIQEFSRSEVSQREYCRQHDISYWSFNYWKRKFESGPSTTGIVEVPRHAVESMSPNHHLFEIHIGGSVRIIIPPGFDSTELEKILRVMGAVL